MAIASEPMSAEPGLAKSARCDACDSRVDSLRAPYVALIASRFRFYCSRGCHARRHEARIERGSALPESGVSGAPRVSRTSLEKTVGMLGLDRSSLVPDVRSASPGSSRESAPGRPSASAALAQVYRSARSRSLTTYLFSTVVFIVALGLRTFAGVGDGARWATTFVLTGVMLAVGIREAWIERKRSAALLTSLLPAVGIAVLVVDHLLSNGLGAASARAASQMCEIAILAAVFPASMRAACDVDNTVLRRFVRLAGSVPWEQLVSRPGGEKPTPARDVRSGEEIEVSAGDFVPVDGIVRSGSAVLRVERGAGGDVSRSVGDAVLAGTMVVTGSLRVLATRSGDEVARIRLAGVMQTEVGRHGSTAWVRRVLGALGIVVPAVAIASALIQRWSFGRAPLVVLGLCLAAAPVAIALRLQRVPSADAVARAAERGVLFRDIASVERAAAASAVVFCVRGTVTVGSLALANVVTVGRMTDDDVLSLAAALEDADRDQPFSRAVLAVASSRSVAIATVRRPVARPGRGITAIDVRGEPIVLGSRALLLDEGVSVAAAEDAAQEIEARGLTTAFLAVGGRVEAVLGFEDPIRAETRASVQQLIDAGFEVVLVSGVGRGTLEALGSMLDVANVRPEIVPEDRGATVRSVGELADGVVVVGRAETDGAALAAADVAIALRSAGVAGSETNIALASDDLRDAAWALRLAREAVARLVRIGALGSACVLLSVAIIALLPGAGLLAAAAAHGAASVALLALGGASRERAR